jgi:hypothetical protein
MNSAALVFLVVMILGFRPRNAAAGVAGIVSAAALLITLIL